MDGSDGITISVLSTASSLEQSKLVAGIAALTLFMSAKYLLNDIHGCFGPIFETRYIKYLALFSVVFLNTRSFKISLVVASFYFIGRDFFMSRTKDDMDCTTNVVW